MKKLVVFVWLVIFAQICFAVQYQITELGVFGNLNGYSQTAGINNNGQVVGQASYLTSNNDPSHAFVYSNNTMQDLGSLGGPYSYANAINDSSEIVGAAYINQSNYHAFVYSTGAMQDLGTLGGLNSVATGINSSAQISGYSDVSTGYSNAFIYSNDSMQNLGTLGGSSSGAYGINNQGQVVGYSYINGDTSMHSFLYSNGVMQDIGTLNGGRYNAASAINDNGQIVGYGYVGNNFHAYLRSVEGVTIDLGTLGGSTSMAWDINNSGWVVGGVHVNTTIQWQAFVYFDGSMKNLNGLIDPNSGINLQGANGINDNGQISAYGTNADGYSRAFLLTPIPEPSSLILSLFALTIGIFFRRR